MDHPSSDEIKRHVKVYVRVFLALAVLTVVTVAISYQRLALIPAVIAALAIASLKGSLVAGFFMHLLKEKKIIVAILLLAAFFFLFVLLVPSMH